MCVYVWKFNLHSSFYRLSNGSYLQWVTHTLHLLLLGFSKVLFLTSPHFLNLLCVCFSKSLFLSSCYGSFMSFVKPWTVKSWVYVWSFTFSDLHRQYLLVYICLIDHLESLLRHFSLFFNLLPLILRTSLFLSCSMAGKG